MLNKGQKTPFANLMQTAILRCLSHIAKNEENGKKEFKSGQRHQSNPCKWRKYVVCRAFFIKSAFGLYPVFTNGTVKTIFYLLGSASATASIAAACAD